jgi:hypothetical protein
MLAVKKVDGILEFADTKYSFNKYSPLNKTISTAVGMQGP